MNYWKILLHATIYVAVFAAGIIAEKLIYSHGKWEKGFDDGIAFAIEKFVEDKLLKVPKGGASGNFVDCWFVTVLAPPQPDSPINLNGGPSYVGNCIFNYGVLSSRSVKANAHGDFDTALKMQQKDYK